MRVTNQFLFDNFKSDHNKVLTELNRLNTQVSSGQKIQNSYEDSAVYADILRFNSQESELAGIKERSVQARSLTDASDSSLSEFTQTLRDFNTKLIAAGNATMNSDNLETIAIELEEQKKHMISLANTQMNGQYLFSGSATNTKPIDNEGVYHGNDNTLMTLVGDGVEIQSNVDGQSLFLGDDLNVHKIVQTNVKLTNQISDEPLTANSTIRDMVGDNDDNAANDADVDFFISGVKRDGTAFKTTITSLSGSSKLEDLLDGIKNAYNNEVNVELTDNGNIQISDIKSGYSQIEFKMVGVKDSNGSTNLNTVTGEIISFSKSNFIAMDTSKDESLQMDQQYFEKSGGKLEGNVALISDGAFANASTKLSDISSGSLVGKSFTMNLTDIENNPKTITLNLDDPSTFSDGVGSYNIYDADNLTPTTADKFTMGQLNSIIAMTLSDNLPPANNDASTFNIKSIEAKKDIDVSINSNGHLEINDKSDNLSNIQFAMYDNDANDFSKTTTPSLSFMSNNAVTSSQAHLSFFDELDSIIASVRDGVTDLNSDASDPRSIGIQNSIGKLDQMSNHFNNAQSQIGIRSKSLQIAEQKASALELNVMQLKSETTEVDMAETIMKLNQVSLSYEAMLQTITKVNSLSLLNYM